MASNLRVQLKQCVSPPSLRSYGAEFLSTFLFVFAAVGSAVSAQMALVPHRAKGTLPPAVATDASSLVATAVAQSFALFAAVFVAADVSGGHVNPAVTFAFAIGGHIGALNAVFYWAAQLLGSTFACLVLQFFSAGEAPLPTTRIAVQMTGFGASIIEAVITFMLVYTVHVVADPRAGAGAGGRKGTATTALGSLAVGLVCGACVLAAGSLTGASMNPARSFGPAVVRGSYANQAVYWVGPMIGAALAALVHQNLMFPSAPEPHGAVETVVV